MKFSDSRGVSRRLGVAGTRQADLSVKGYSLVEIVCVLAIIGVMVSLLLPAVQSAREKARGVACQNQIRQLSLGCAGFETTHRTFPPGTLGFSEPCNVTYEQYQRVFDDPSSPFYFLNQQHTSWVLQVLPWIEQQAIYESVPAIARNANQSYLQYRTGNPTAPMWLDGFSEIQAASSQDSASLLCPSDSLTTVNQKGPVTTIVGSQPIFVLQPVLDLLHGKPVGDFQLGYLGPTNYAGCTGGYSGGELPQMANSTVDEMSRFRGIFRSRKSASLGAIRDGTSQTILFGEVVGFIDFKVRSSPSSWMFGGLARGRSVLDWGTNYSTFLPGLEILGDQYYAWPAGFASLHPRHVNFGYADGTVRPITRTVDPWVMLSACGINDAASNFQLPNSPAP